MATYVIFSLVIALTLSIIFGLVVNRKASGTGYFLFFLGSFLITLTAALRVRPFVPLGVYWLLMVIIGLPGTVFLYYRAQRAPPYNREETIEILEWVKKRRQLQKIIYLTMDLLFGISLVLLCAAILLYLLDVGMSLTQHSETVSYSP